MTLSHRTHIHTFETPVHDGESTILKMFLTCFTINKKSKNCYKQVKCNFKKLIFQRTIKVNFLKAILFAKVYTWKAM